MLAGNCFEKIALIACKRRCGAHLDGAQSICRRGLSASELIIVRVCGVSRELRAGCKLDAPSEVSALDDAGIKRAPTRKIKSVQ